MNAFLLAPIAHLSPTWYYHLRQAGNGSANGRGVAETSRPMFCGICGWCKGIRFEIQECLSAISSSFNFSRNEIEAYTLMTQ